MKQLKVITYNIDGLPETLDLNDLPWIFKPIAWIYKLIKKTSIVKINDNKDTSKKMIEIGQYFINSNADIIGIQEDFNYHKELMDKLHNKYLCGTYSGGFDISKIFTSVEILSHFPLPRFKADGINIISKKGINISNENIVSWKKSYGYIDHANDLLTHKGFRFYTVTTEDNINIDMYILHMDADFYHPENCPDVLKDVEARKEQINQLLSYIIDRFKNEINNPVIVMGDTNSYDKYEWDVKNISYFIGNINNIPELECKEAIPENYNDCDRIFFINNDKSKYKLELNKCYFDKEICLSDHKPLEATFTLTENN